LLADTPNEMDADAVPPVTTPAVAMPMIGAEGTPTGVTPLEIADSGL
jgi:hypothetical protein